MLYIFYGPDQFRLREEVNRLRAAMDRDGNLTHNTVRLEGRGLSAGDLAAACQTASFFAEDRLVIVDGLQARLSGARRGRARAGGGASGELEAFAAVLQDLPPTTTVVLVDEKSGPLTDLLKDRATVKPFQTMKQTELESWAHSRIREREADFHAAAVKRLLELIDGEHTGELANEIDKLATYALGRKVTVADVDAMVSAAKETKIWDLTDPMTAGHTDRALEAYERLDDREYPPVMVLAIIRNHFRRLVLAKALQLEGASMAQIGEKLGMRPGYPLEKLAANASRFAPERLDTAYRLLLQADVNVKTGVMDAEAVLPALITELTELGRPAGPARRVALR